MTNDQNYILLRGVLDRAYEQAAGGKGAQRHAQGQPFEKQPMQKLIDLYGVGFALGQAGKKAQESQRMEHEPAVRELLGAINYLAGAVIALEMREKERVANELMLAAELASVELRCQAELCEAALKNNPLYAQVPSP